MTTIIDQTLSKGKKTLDELLRNKAFENIAQYLKEQNIDINEISDSDLEELIAAKVTDMNSKLKGFGAGSAFVVLLEALL